MSFPSEERRIVRWLTLQQICKEKFGNEDVYHSIWRTLQGCPDRFRRKIGRGRQKVRWLYYEPYIDSLWPTPEVRQ